jgi:hypothetical protein
MNTTIADHNTLRAAWSAEIAAVETAAADRDRAREWQHLERAHIISQPLAGRHVRTHMMMLKFAVRRVDVREGLGQMFRILVAAPGSWTGRYPVGNTGGTNVSAFEPTPIPDDLHDLFATARVVEEDAVS